MHPLQPVLLKLCTYQKASSAALTTAVPATIAEETPALGAGEHTAEQLARHGASRVSSEGGHTNGLFARSQLSEGSAHIEPDTFVNWLSFSCLVVEQLINNHDNSKRASQSASTRPKPVSKGESSVDAAHVNTAQP